MIRDSQFSTRFAAVRQHTQQLCAPLSPEDHVPQPVPEVSPPKWHLAHTSWFFEAMLLQPFLPGYRVFHPQFGYLFNSYYDGIGERVLRGARGHLSRPSVAEVMAYRAHVDAAMQRLLAQPLLPQVAALVELGLQHEQQHQELLLTDLKVVLATNVIDVSYAAAGAAPVDLAAEHAAESVLPEAWVGMREGAVEVGHAGAGFCFDNETPRHVQHVPAMQLRSTLVSNEEYLAFMADGGYERFGFWHAEGWDWARSLPIKAPLHWQPDPDRSGRWLHFTLSGLQPLPQAAPVTHISFYEAYAFCQWAGWRLPTEFEWEALAPRLAWGRRWEWTSSAYQPYPGFRPASGAVGEYNGKFMVNQQVLRGASYATPPNHARVSYRNFFHAPLRWQYTSIRPARDAAGSTGVSGTAG